MTRVCLPLILLCVVCPVSSEMKHHLGKEQISDYWYTLLKQTFNLTFIADTECNILGASFDGQILSDTNSFYYLPGDIFYCERLSTVQDVSSSFAANGEFVFDMTDQNILKAIITEPIKHVRIQVVSSNCVYLMAYMSLLTEVNVDYVRYSEDIYLVRSTTKIPENANQALFTNGLEYKTGEFLTLHQPTSVHRNLFVVCLGFTEMAARLEIKLDFEIKVPEDEDNSTVADSGANNDDSNVVVIDPAAGSGSGTSDPDPGSGTNDPNQGSGSVETPPPIIEEPEDTVNDTAGETANTTTKEEITPKTIEEVGSLDQDEETTFIQNVISYFEEKEKENVIVIEQAQIGTVSPDGSTGNGQVGTVVDTPDGKGKEIVTVQTVKAKISKLYSNSYLCIFVCIFIYMYMYMYMYVYMYIYM